MTAEQSPLKFPKNFLWGTGTSSYQIEGAVNEDGRGESIWDRFSHTPGKVDNDDNGDIADDHYHLFEQDLDLLKEIGVLSYRYSIAWPRVIPTGSGEVNQKGLDFYKRLTDGLLKRGIEPMVTLYHWDLPQALEDKGGWTNRDTVDRFVEYSSVLFNALGDRVRNWTTHNEPKVVAELGYLKGIHAPGIKDRVAYYHTVHHLLLSHGKTVQAFRAMAPSENKISIVLNLWPIYPHTESEADLEAAYIIDGMENRLYLDPLFQGKYPTDVLADMEKTKPTSTYIKPGDLEIIKTPFDFLGINYYNPYYVSGSPNGPVQVYGGHPQTAMEWEVYPQALYDILTRLKKDYTDLPLYVTENGAAFDDKLMADGEVNDLLRRQYLHDHMTAVARAIEAGVEVKGYFVWSFLDNFEWAWGYQKRFGLTYVDYATQKRTLKKSALWYREVIRANALKERPS